LNTYIIHVPGYTAREVHMKKQLNDKNLQATWILQGNKSDLTPEVLEKYFSGEMKSISPATSCAFKHLLAYEALIKSGSESALILEDDIFLDAAFSTRLHKIEREICERKLHNYLISLEDSSLTYVKGSERIPGQMLYPNSRGRMAGAYLIDRACAISLIDLVQRHRCHLPVDWFHNFAAGKGTIQIFWAHPVLATQGSLNGAIPTTLDQKRSGGWRRLSFQVQRWYKKLLWRLR
jgi:glycosyl transferase, family 25